VHMSAAQSDASAVRPDDGIKSSSIYILATKVANYSFSKEPKN